MQRSAFVVGVLSTLVACSSTAPEPEGEEQRQTAAQALQVDLHPNSISYDYATFDVLPAGVAGTKKVVFVGSPLEGRVTANSRLGGQHLGDLPAPPGGFILPFIMHSDTQPGRIAVLDAGGLPSPNPFYPVNPTIYEYEYQASWGGSFSAELVNTISFDSVTVGFAEDAAKLADGRYLVSDAVLGALWVVETDGSIHLGIGDGDNVPGNGVPELDYCPTMPQVEVAGVPFLFSGSTLPGASPLAIQDGQAFFYSPCAEGLYSFPLSILDDDRDPEARADDIAIVSAKPAEVEVEQLLGLTFNPYRPDDRFLYAADSLQLQVIRIDVTNGAREVVADDPTLFNFPSSISFLPPLWQGVSPMVVVSNQQHLTPLTNGAITEDMFEPPFIATKVFLFH